MAWIIVPGGVRVYFQDGGIALFALGATGEEAAASFAL
jgi:hypothetical protein